MPDQRADLSALFRAMSDPTRRAVVERLGHGPTPTTELARPFDMALQSFIQHLDVLEHSGLVESHKQGRVRTYDLVTAPLAVAEDWLSAQRQIWERRLDQLDAYVQKIQDGAQ